MRPSLHPPALASLVLAMGLALGAMGCVGAGSGGEGVVDLAVIQSVTVEFEAMEGDQPMATDDRDLPMDLDAETQYLEVRAALACAGLDLQASSIHVTELDDSVLDTVLLVQLEVAPRDGEVWKPVAEFNGSVTLDSLVPLHDPGFTIFTEGVDLLTTLALDPITPRYDLRIIGEVPAPIAWLELDVILELDFSSRPDRCPTLLPEG